MEKLEEWAETITNARDPYSYENAREKLIKAMRRERKAVVDVVNDDRASFILVSALSECLGEYTSLTGDNSILEALSLWLEREHTPQTRDIALYVEDAKRTYSSLFIKP